MWQAGQAGDRKARPRILFSPLGPELRFQQYSGEGGEACRQARELMADNLREDCDAEGLESLGIHMARESPVAQDLETDEFADRDPDVHRQMAAFAHRYAAGRLKDRVQPAREARDPEFSLTPGQEARAREVGKEMISDCS